MQQNRVADSDSSPRPSRPDLPPTTRLAVVGRPVNFPRLSRASKKSGATSSSALAFTPI